MRPVWHEKCFKIDYKTAVDAGIAQHGSLTALDEAYVHLLDVEEEDRINIDVIYGLHDGGVFDLARFGAIVQVLWVNKVLQELDWGFFCAGCAKIAASQDGCHLRRLYTNERFDEHLSQYAI
jgi:hypothetical protein